MKKTFLILFFSIQFSVFAQVGIGTDVPHSSAILDVAAIDKGIIFPKMSSAQRAAIVSPAAGLYVFDTNTNSLWIYNGSTWANTVAEASYGDIKSGFQGSDHSGWIKLDGRTVSTLTVSQKNVAASLGFTTNLPNATDSYPVQKTGTLGSLVGSNTKTISQANLPSVTFTGSTTGGDHAHTASGSFTRPRGDQTWSNGGGSSWWGWTNGVTQSVSVTVNSSSHTHGVNVNSGGSNTPMDIQPRGMVVNMFVYLGQ
jgi:hypothetical protein